MVAIRDILICLVGVVAASTICSAQSKEVERDTRYQKLAQSAEQAVQGCDSLQRLTDAARLKYGSEVEGNREALSADILRYEQELSEAFRAKESALNALIAFESDWVVNNMNRATAPVAEVETTPARSVEDFPKRANLVENGYFICSLNAADMRSLREAQGRESHVNRKIAEYHTLYDRMVALKHEYERVETPTAADSLLVELERVRSRAVDMEDSVMKSWQSVYDNKIYLYNLALELNLRTDLLSEWERCSLQAQMALDNDTGTYESDALALLYNQKRALLSYEQHLASALSLTTAKDSLKRAYDGLRRESLCLPRVTVQERLFIDYEPLKVVLPTIYNAKNPIPRTRIYERGTIYRIRIGVFNHRPNVSALRGITPLSWSDAYHDGKCAYFVGGFATEADAREAVTYLKGIGFRDPLISMWVDGEYVPDIEQWKKNNAARYKIEITGAESLSDAVKTHIGLRNADLRISRVGKTFVVGEFLSRDEAETLAREVRSMMNAEAEVVEVKK